MKALCLGLLQFVVKRCGPDREIVVNRESSLRKFEERSDWRTVTCAFVRPREMGAAWDHGVVVQVVRPLLAVSLPTVSGGMIAVNLRSASSSHEFVRAT